MHYLKLATGLNLLQMINRLLTEGRKAMACATKTNIKREKMQAMMAYIRRYGQDMTDAEINAVMRSFAEISRI